MLMPRHFWSKIERLNRRLKNGPTAASQQILQPSDQGADKVSYRCKCPDGRFPSITITNEEMEYHAHIHTCKDPRVADHSTSTN